MAWRSILDKLFCGYFIYQIPTTILLESQSMFPARYYPKVLRDINANYVRDFRDPFMGDVNSFPWFKALCVKELSFDIPVYFIAAYAFFKGARQCPWIRIPALVYGVSTICAILSILSTIWFQDFSLYKVAAPRNFDEKLKLSGVYGSYLVVVVIMVFDTWWGSGYLPEIEEKKAKAEMEAEEDEKKTN